MPGVRLSCRTRGQQRRRPLPAPPPLVLPLSFPNVGSVYYRIITAWVHSAPAWSCERRFPWSRLPALPVLHRVCVDSCAWYRRAAAPLTDCRARVPCYTASARRRSGSMDALWRRRTGRWRRGSGGRLWRLWRLGRNQSLWGALAAWGSVAGVACVILQSLWHAHSCRRPQFRE